MIGLSVHRAFIIARPDLRKSFATEQLTLRICQKPVVGRVSVVGAYDRPISPDQELYVSCYFILLYFQRCVTAF